MDIRNLPLREPFTAIVVVVSFYLASYVVISLSGAWGVGWSGTLRYGGSLPVSDIEEWQPRALSYRRYVSVTGEWTSNGSALGFLYSPLVRLDRAYWHRTRFLFEVDMGRPSATNATP